MKNRKRSGERGLIKGNDIFKAVLLTSALTVPCYVVAAPASVGSVMIDGAGGGGAGGVADLQDANAGAVLDAGAVNLNALRGWDPQGNLIATGDVGIDNPVSPIFASYWTTNALDNNIVALTITPPTALLSKPLELCAIAAEGKTFNAAVNYVMTGNDVQIGAVVQGVYQADGSINLSGAGDAKSWIKFGLDENTKQAITLQPTAATYALSPANGNASQALAVPVNNTLDALVGVDLGTVASKTHKIVFELGGMTEDVTISQIIGERAAGATGVLEVAVLGLPRDANASKTLTISELTTAGVAINNTNRANLYVGAAGKLVVGSAYLNDVVLNLSAGSTQITFPNADDAKLITGTAQVRAGGLTLRSQVVDTKTQTVIAGECIMGDPNAHAVVSPTIYIAPSTLGADETATLKLAGVTLNEGTLSLGDSTNAGNPSKVTYILASFMVPRNTSKASVMKLEGMDHDNSHPSNASLINVTGDFTVQNSKFVGQVSTIGGNLSLVQASTLTITGGIDDAQYLNRVVGSATNNGVLTVKGMTKAGGSVFNGTFTMTDGSFTYEGSDTLDSKIFNGAATISGGVIKLDFADKAHTGKVFIADSSITGANTTFNVTGNALNSALLGADDKTLTVNNATVAISGTADMSALTSVGTFSALGSLSLNNSGKFSLCSTMDAGFMKDLTVTGSAAIVLKQANNANANITGSVKLSDLATGNTSVIFTDANDVGSRFVIAESLEITIANNATSAALIATSQSFANNAVDANDALIVDGFQGAMQVVKSLAISGNNGAVGVFVKPTLPTILGISAPGGTLDVVSKNANSSVIVLGKIGGDNASKVSVKAANLVIYCQGMEVKAADGINFESTLNGTTPRLNVYSTGAILGTANDAGITLTNTNLSITGNGGTLLATNANGSITGTNSNMSVIHTGGITDYSVVYGNALSITGGTFAVKAEEIGDDAGANVIKTTTGITLSRATLSLIAGTIAENGKVIMNTNAAAIQGSGGSSLNVQCGASGSPNVQVLNAALTGLGNVLNVNFADGLGNHGGTFVTGASEYLNVTVTPVGDLSTKLFANTLSNSVLQLALAGNSINAGAVAVNGNATAVDFTIASTADVNCAATGLFGGKFDGGLTVGSTNHGIALTSGVFVTGNSTISRPSTMYLRDIGTAGSAAKIFNGTLTVNESLNILSTAVSNVDSRVAVSMVTVAVNKSFTLGITGAVGSDAIFGGDVTSNGATNIVVGEAKTIVVGDTVVAQSGSFNVQSAANANTIVFNGALTCGGTLSAEFTVVSDAGAKVFNGAAFFASSADATVNLPDAALNNLFADNITLQQGALNLVGVGATHEIVVMPNDKTLTIGVANNASNLNFSNGKWKLSKVAINGVTNASAINMAGTNGSQVVITGAVGADVAWNLNGAMLTLNQGNGAIKFALTANKKLSISNATNAAITINSVTAGNTPGAVELLTSANAQLTFANDDIADIGVAKIAAWTGNGSKIQVNGKTQADSAIITLDVDRIVQGGELNVNVEAAGGDKAIKYLLYSKNADLTLGNNAKININGSASNVANTSLALSFANAQDLQLGAGSELNIAMLSTVTEVWGANVQEVKHGVGSKVKLSLNGASAITKITGWTGSTEVAKGGTTDVVLTAALIEGGLTAGANTVVNITGNYKYDVADKIAVTGVVNFGGNFEISGNASSNSTFQIASIVGDCKITPVNASKLFIGTQAKASSITGAIILEKSTLGLYVDSSNAANAGSKATLKDGAVFAIAGINDDLNAIIASDSSDMSSATQLLDITSELDIVKSKYYAPSVKLKLGNASKITDSSNVVLAAINLDSKTLEVENSTLTLFGNDKLFNLASSKGSTIVLQNATAGGLSFTSGSADGTILSYQGGASDKIDLSNVGAGSSVKIGGDIANAHPITIKELVLPSTLKNLSSNGNNNIIDIALEKKVDIQKISGSKGLWINIISANSGGSLALGNGAGSLDSLTKLTMVQDAKIQFNAPVQVQLVLKAGVQVLTSGESTLDLSDTTGEVSGSVITAGGDVKLKLSKVVPEILYFTGDKKQLTLHVSDTVLRIDKVMKILGVKSATDLTDTTANAPNIKVNTSVLLSNSDVNWAFGETLTAPLITLQDGKIVGSGTIVGNLTILGGEVLGYPTIRGTLVMRGGAAQIETADVLDVQSGQITVRQVTGAVMVTGDSVSKISSNTKDVLFKLTASGQTPTLQVDANAPNALSIGKINIESVTTKNGIKVGGKLDLAAAKSVTVESVGIWKDNKPESMLESLVMLGQTVSFRDSAAIYNISVPDQSKPSDGTIVLNGGSRYYFGQVAAAMFGLDVSAGSTYVTVGDGSFRFVNLTLRPNSSKDTVLIAQKAGVVEFTNVSVADQSSGDSYLVLSDQDVVEVKSDLSTEISSVIAAQPRVNLLFSSDLTLRKNIKVEAGSKVRFAKNVALGGAVVPSGEGVTVVFENKENSTFSGNIGREGGSGVIVALSGKDVSFNFANAPVIKEVVFEGAQTMTVDQSLDGANITTKSNGAKLVFTKPQQLTGAIGSADYTLTLIGKEVEFVTASDIYAQVIAEKISIASPATSESTNTPITLFAAGDEKNAAQVNVSGARVVMGRADAPMYIKSLTLKNSTVTMLSDLSNQKVEISGMNSTFTPAANAILYDIGGGEGFRVSFDTQRVPGLNDQGADYVAVKVAAALGGAGKSIEELIIPESVEQLELNNAAIFSTKALPLSELEVVVSAPSTLSVKNATDVSNTHWVLNSNLVMYGDYTVEASSKTVLDVAFSSQDKTQLVGTMTLGSEDGAKGALNLADSELVLNVNSSLPSAALKSDKTIVVPVITGNVISDKTIVVVNHKKDKYLKFNGEWSSAGLRLSISPVSQEESKEITQEILSEVTTPESVPEITKALVANGPSVTIEEVTNVIAAALNDMENVEMQKTVSTLMNKEEVVLIQDESGASVNLTQAQRVAVAYSIINQPTVSTRTVAASTETGAQTISMAASTALSSISAAPVVVSTKVAGVGQGVAAGDGANGTVWVKPFIGGGKQAQRDKQSRFDNTAYGLLCGGHSQASDNLMGGALLGYFKNDTRVSGVALLGTNDKIGSGSILAGLYGAYTPTEKWNIQANLLLAFTHVNSKSKRAFLDEATKTMKVADAKAKYNNNSLSLQLLANYYAVINDSSALVPSIGLYVNRNGEYSYKEEGDAKVVKSESTTSASVVPQGVFGIRYVASSVGQGYALGGDAHANVYQSFCSVAGKNTTTYANNPGSAPVPTLLPGGEKTVLNVGTSASFDAHVVQYSLTLDYYVAVQTGYRAVQGVISIDCKL